MKPSILPLALFVIALSSCTTAYKSGQTPDDVYFSPARPEEEYVKTEWREEYRGESEEYYDDYYLRMKVRNRYRWSEFEDPYYYRSPYITTVNSCCYCKDAWTPYNSWNYYYNPYYRFNNPNTRNTVYSAPRKVNLGAYNPQANNTQTKSYGTPRRYAGNSNTYSSPRVTTTNKDDGNSGNVLRNIINNGSSNTKNTSSGSTNNSSGNSSNNNSSSSSSSGSSGSTAPVRKF